MSEQTSTIAPEDIWLIFVLMVSVASLVVSLVIMAERHSDCTPIPIILERADDAHQVAN